MPPNSPKSVGWPALLITVLIVWLLMSALAGMGAWWVWHNLSARVQLHDQSARVMLPPNLAVRAAVSNLVEVRLDQNLPIKVPIHQTLSIPMDDPVPLHVRIDTVVPIDLEVPLDHVLHVDQQIELDTKVKTRVLGIPVTVPIQGRVPLKADVPIKLIIPVHKQLPVSVSAPASVRLTGPLSVKVDTVIETTVPIHESLKLPVTAPVNAMLHFPEQEVTAGLRFIDVTLPLQAVDFEALPLPWQAQQPGSSAGLSSKVSPSARAVKP